MKNLVSVFLLVLMLTACTQYDGFIEEKDVSTRELLVPDDFNFSLTSALSLKINVQNDDYSLSGVPIKVYLDDPGSNEEPNLEARFSRTLVSDADGKINTQLELPSHIEKLYLVTDYIGLPRVTILPIQSAVMEYSYGEETGIEPAILPAANRSAKSGFIFTPMGTWNGYGVPNYLLTERDQVSQELLENINASLPEGRKLPESHPSYLEAGNQANVVVNESADIWVTFVHEGAGYRNTLGYYVYNQGEPPVTVDDIDEINIIFPNVSFRWSGGGLRSGDKVYLGQFEPGQAIGWVILANGYQSNGNFNANQIYFSDRRFNPESTDDRKQHMVLLHDSQNDILLMGFEDLNRDGNTDDDFNDAIFYVTANPISAIEIKDVPPIDTPDDTDNDGVSDTFDDYPEDPTLAYNNHYPAEGQFGTIIAEDLWPSYGDFDFNDLVLEYHFQSIANPQNKIAKMAIDVRVKAIGASFRNGFGIELPISPNRIKSVKGISGNFDFVKLSSNGTEAGQSNAVIVFFEDAYQVLPFIGNGSGVNTDMGEPKSEPQMISVEIEFASPISLADLGSEPYNPFVIINKERGKELHLPAKSQTSLADESYFGSGQDDTDPGRSKYYQSEGNLPWMLNIPSTFLYPQEKSDIIQGYKFFAEWARSGGVMNKDWYTEKDGNRDLSRLYTK